MTVEPHVADTGVVSLVAHAEATPKTRRKGSASTGDHGDTWRVTDDPQPHDSVPVHLPRWLRDKVEQERDRLDPPVDGLGRKRPQQSMSAFVERLVRKGMQWSMSLPAWTDPLAIEGDNLRPDDPAGE